MNLSFPVISVKRVYWDDTLPNMPTDACVVQERHPALGAAAPDVSSCDTREFLNGEHRRQRRSAHRATVIPSSAVRLNSLLKIAAGAAQEVAEC